MRELRAKLVAEGKTALYLFEWGAICIENRRS
jgi:hypothetical protein